MSTQHPVVLDVSAHDRTQAKAGDFSWVQEYAALACHFGVWDEGFNFDRSKRHEVIAGADRRRFCFFWRYRPGMLIPAAKVLQEREAQARETSRDRRLTLWGLWIAVLALLAQVWISVAAQLKLWPFR